MKTLNLKLLGGTELNPIVKIDGKVVQYKRNKYKTAEIVYQTEKDVVDVEIGNVLEIKGPCWWLIQMFFFVISLFGILNPKLEKFCYLINFKAKINIGENSNEVMLKFNLLKDKTRAIEISSPNIIEESVNEYLIDLETKKRKKILKISRILSWILLISVVLLIIFVKI